jgi:CO dehydrogenase nickel-insertion accessory protein CooC1
MVPRSDGAVKTSAAVDAVVIAIDFSEHAAYAASRVAVLAEEINMSKVTVLQFSKNRV